MSLSALDLDDSAMLQLATVDTCLPFFIFFSFLRDSHVKKMKENTLPVAMEMINDEMI